VSAKGVGANCGSPAEINEFECKWNSGKVKKCNSINAHSSVGAFLLFARLKDIGTGARISPGTQPYK